MLPRRSRLRSSREFARTVRSGRRARVGPLVGYLRRTGEPVPPQLGLIVSRQVGNSVARHRVSRVVRHGIAADLARLPDGAVLVVRALPDAARRDGEIAEAAGALVDRLTRAT